MDALSEYMERYDGDEYMYATERFALLVLRILGKSRIEYSYDLPIHDKEKAQYWCYGMEIVDIVNVGNIHEKIDWSKVYQLQYKVGDIIDTCILATYSLERAYGNFIEIDIRNDGRFDFRGNLLMPIIAVKFGSKIPYEKHTYTKYSDNGRLEAIIPLLNGRLHGRMTWYDENGEMHADINYDNGTLKGRIIVNFGCYIDGNINPKGKFSGMFIKRKDYPKFRYILKDDHVIRKEQAKIFYKLYNGKYVGKKYYVMNK